MIKSEIARLMLRVLLFSAIFAALAAAAAAILGGARSAFSIGAGALLALASFAALAISVAGAASPGTAMLRKGLLAGLGIFKLAIIGALLWWLISSSKVEPMPLLAGFSAVVAALVVEGARAGRARQRVG